MVDDRLDDAGSPPESGRAKRPPPTIDLDASEISSETKAVGEPAPEPKFEPNSDIRSDAGPDIQPEPVSASRAAREAEDDIGERPKAAVSPSISRPISPWVIAPFSGAVAAALVIAVGWMLGWPPVQPAPSGPKISAVDELTARVAGLESKSGKPASDPAAAARLDAVEKSLNASRAELASLRAQSDRLASAMNEAKSAPRDAAGAIDRSADHLSADHLSADLLALNERIAQIERAGRAPGADAAQPVQPAEPIQPAKADDVPLRRLVAAALLDVAVRHGDPYTAALSAAKSLAPNPDDLKPLDEFSAIGVPNPALLSRELLTLVPKLSPTPAQDNPTTGTGGLVDRLQAGAAKLVRIERTDGTGNDRGAVVARVTAAALRNDFVEARRELNTLAPADRAAAQGWLDKAAARDAALAASRQFAADAMTALAKPAQ
jgi:hypothetical protein